MLTVHSIPDAFSVMECDRIVTALTSAPSKDALLVGKVQDDSFRISDLVWMDDVSGTGWIMDRLIDLVRRSNSNIFDFDLREFAESPQAATYQAAKSGHFAWHSDIGDGPTARKRKLTLVLQLSTPEAYDGGDLEIMPGAHVLSASRAQGCVSIFPSFSLHQVTPVTRGVRQSITVWAHGPAFR